MTKLWNYLFNYRMRALIRKEFAQTRHDRKLMFSLTVLPVVQLTLVGFALSAAVTNVRLAVVDDSRSPESRELIATLTASRAIIPRSTNLEMQSARAKPMPEWSFLTTMRGICSVIARQLFNSCSTLRMQIQPP
jgi:hypothetical protein